MAGAKKVRPKVADRRVCVVCRVNRSNNAGQLCRGCKKAAADEARDAEAARLAAEVASGVPAVLVDLRWVQEHPGEKGEGRRGTWVRFAERNPLAFQQRLDDEEKAYAESKKLAVVEKEKPIEDEGIERCIELCDQWLKDNEEK